MEKTETSSRRSQPNRKADLTGSFLMAQKGRIRASIRSGEDGLLVAFVCLSICIHILVIMAGEFSWFSSSRPIIEEWSMDAELVTDFGETAAPDKSALPKAEIADEAKVSERMLPAVPKKFAIVEPAKPEDMVDEVADPTEVVKKPTPEPIKKAEEKPDPKLAALNIKADKDEQNRLKKSEALDRLFREKLRRDKKLAKKTQAEQEDPYARLANEVLKNKKLNSGRKGQRMSTAARKYGERLNAAIGSNYSVPSIYNYKDQELAVLVAVVLSDNGTIRDLEVAKSSGESAFDQFVLDAIRSSSPLAPPPKELVGLPIHLRFTPRSF